MTAVGLHEVTHSAILLLPIPDARLRAYYRVAFLILPPFVSIFTANSRRQPDIDRRCVIAASTGATAT